MARINKEQTLKRMMDLGQISSKGAIMNEGGDDVKASIVSPEGKEIAPAALKEGEIVFSIPSIIGAGEGDFDKGSEIILALHERLKTLGEQILQEQSLASKEI